MGRGMGNLLGNKGRMVTSAEERLVEVPGVCEEVIRVVAEKKRKGTTW